MLLQTNSYVVPKERRAEHARLMARFRQCFRRLGSGFEVYEATGTGFAGDGGGRFVQLMRFRDRRHHAEVNAREGKDPVAQKLIAEFCNLVNIAYQQQHGLFAAGFYAGVLRDGPGDRAENSLVGESPSADATGEDEKHVEHLDPTPVGEFDAESGLGHLVDPAQEMAAMPPAAPLEPVAAAGDADAPDDFDPFADEMEGEVVGEEAAPDDTDVAFDARGHLRDDAADGRDRERSAR